MSWNPAELDPEFPYDLVSPSFALDRERTALAVIDMQTDYLRIANDSPLGEKYPVLAAEFNRRVDQVVLPALVTLISAFRAAGLRVVYTRNGAMTSTGQEMSGRLRALNNPPKIYRGTAGYEIVDELRPAPDELVIDKLTSGAFTSTNLDHALRNYGVENIVVTGVFTDMCVLGSARVGAELGYNTLICDDACAALTRRAHDEALLNHARRFGRVATSAGVHAELGL